MDPNPKHPEPSPIVAQNDLDPLYEIVKLLDRREAVIRVKQVKKYLVQYDGWGPAHNI